MRYRLLTILLISASLTSEFSHSAEQYWPQWRGPTLNGVATEADPPIHWNNTQNLKWKVPIAGRGQSTPIIWGDNLLLVTAVPMDRELPPYYEVPKGTPRIGDHNAVIKEWKAQSLRLICVDRTTGRQRWQQTVREVMPHQGHHWKGSFAPASPITDGERVIAYFGSFGLYCYDLSGHLIWKRDICPQAMEDNLGEGSSPALWGDKIVVVVDHELQSFIVALDKTTGREIWRTDRQEVSNWSTPRIFVHEGRPQVVVNGQDVICYDLENGEEIWRCGGQSEGAIPIPAIGHNMVFATSGFAEDNLHAIRLGQRGDLTGSRHVLWSLDRGTPYVPCPMLWGDEIYLLEDRNFFSCLNAVDGQRHYFKRRLPGGLKFSASPVGAADRIYLLSEQGETVVLRRGPKLDILAVNSLGEICYASPAIVGKAIYLRGEEHLFCFERED